MKRLIYLLLGMLLLAVGVTACHYRTTLPNGLENRLTADSLPLLSPRPYALNSNFKILADTLWLHQLPFTDSVPVERHDRVVVAEFAVFPDNDTDSVWVKVARDQETIGWLPEQELLQHVVPVDPISQCIHWFSNVRVVYLFLVIAFFFLLLVYRAVGRKQIKLIWLNDIDSIFPLMLSWLLAFSATIYNTLQYFVPETWERYYYNPSLNPLDLPFILGLFILCLWLILVLGVALLDDLFHQISVEVALFYLVGLAACCIFIYIFFTCVWIYVCYVCLAAYTVWCIRKLIHSDAYPYACGACGAKMRKKGICPHCGALNE